MISKPLRSFGQALGLTLLFITTGCEEESAKPTSGNDTTATKPSGHVAQPKLETIQLFLGAAELTAEIADENHERMAGMMHRTEMGEKEAMIFAFPYPHQTGFWMKNTLVPLSIAYIDRDSRIVEIYDLHPGNTKTAESRSKRIMYALEVNQGWFGKNGIKLGTVISTPKGSLAKSLRGR